MNGYYCLLILRNFTVLMSNTFCVSCIFPVGTITTNEWVIDLISLVTVGPSCDYTYSPTTVFKCLSKKITRRVMIYLRKWLYKITCITRNEFNNTTTKYTKWITNCLWKVTNGRFEVTILNISLINLVPRSPPPHVLLPLWRLLTWDPPCQRLPQSPQPIFFITLKPACS